MARRIKGPMRHYGSVRLCNGQERIHLPSGLQVKSLASLKSVIDGYNQSTSLLVFRSMEGTHAPLNDPSVCVLIIDSGVKHQLSGSEYPLRRSQCEQAAQILKVDYLRDVNKEDLDGTEHKKLQRLYKLFTAYFTSLAHKAEMDDEVYRRALHVVNETEYTLDFVDHLEKKCYTEAGRCMLNSHNSLRCAQIVIARSR